MNVIFFFAALIVSFEQPADDKPTIDLTGIKCVVSGKAADSAYSVKYKKGQVFFDCNASKRRFDEYKKIYSAKANHQLVVTSQYVQIHCPFKSVPITAENESVLLGGVKLRICCPTCLKSLNSMAGKQQRLEVVFANSTFDKSFVPVSSKRKTVDR